MNTRALARWTAAWGASLTGARASHAARRRASGRFGIILRYHRVIPREEPDSVYRMGIGIDLFARQMEWLARHKQVVSLDEFLRRRDARGKAPERDLVVLTFDDGYRDNGTHAAPILQSLGLPATFYITSSCVRERMPFWPEILARMIERTRASSLRIDGAVLATDPAPLPQPIPLGSPAERRRACLGLIARIRTLPMTRIAAALDAVASALDADKEAAREAAPPVLSAEEICAMDRAGFTIGSHTVTHPYLASETEERQREELVASRAELEGVLEKPVVHFCYPGGGYTERTRRLVEEAGYRSATTSDLGIAGIEDDPFRLPRVGVGEGLARDPWGRFSGTMFDVETSGYMADLYRTRRRQRMREGPVAPPRPSR